MLRLKRLRVESPDLKDLTGLEHAINLTDLSLGTVGIVSDLTPISTLITLRNLNLGGNQISDIRPLAGLINLRGLILWSNKIQDIAPLANLTNLTDLNLARNDIENLQPLEELIHLRILDLSHNRVENIAPLANLIALTKLILSHNQVSDLNPLTGLAGLTYLNLKNNRISALHPLTGLIEVTFLHLRNNRIGDFSPLANLINLKELWIDNNLGTDISPLRGLNLTEFYYDAICDLAPYTPSVTERIGNRRFPSVLRAGGLRGLEHKTEEERVALHDLYIQPWIGIEWHVTEAEPTFGLSTQVAGNLKLAQETHRKQQELNPNLVNLISISWFATGNPNRLPPDSEFWLRDENGEIVNIEIPGRWFEYQTDFFHPGYQELLVNRIVALANCGLFDGIWLDGFRSNATGFPGRHLRPQNDEEIIDAITSILSRVRARVRDDFLILVNVNRTKPTVLYSVYKWHLYGDRIRLCD